jgi:hypothetical protein
MKRFDINTIDDLAEEQNVTKNKSNHQSPQKMQETRYS